MGSSETMTNDEILMTKEEASAPIAQSPSHLISPIEGHFEIERLGDLDIGKFLRHCR